MRLSRVFLIREAGVENRPADTGPKRKRKGFASSAEEPEDDVPEFGEPPEDGEDEDDGEGFAPESDEEGPEEAPDDELDPRNDRKFASEPQRPSARASEEPPGLRVTGDRETLSRLADVLREAAQSSQIDDDEAEWLDDCVRALDTALRRNSDNATLPKFQRTPGLDDFDDVEGDDEED